MALYTSDLLRARTTADALAGIWGTPPHEDPALREISCGTLEGIRLDDLQRTHPDLWARNMAQSDDAFRWPGGESYRSFRARILVVLRRIAAAHPGGSVGVVTHAGVVTQVLGTIVGRSAAVWAADRPDPLTFTEVRWERGSPRAVLSFNRRDWR